MADTKISKSFTWEEFSKSDTAKRLHINNALTTWEVRDNIIALVEDVLQPLRDAWGGPLFINSGYRCLELNKAVGGVPTSQHILGQACDVGVTDPYALAKLVKRMRLDVDQIILYPDFLHVSYRRDGCNRGQILYNKKWKGPKDL